MRQFKGAVKSSVISNFSDGEGVGFFTLATGSLRDNKLRTLDICRDLAVARSRVLLACPFRLARLCSGLR
jgi:hypothetical protein